MATVVVVRAVGEMVAAAMVGEGWEVVGWVVAEMVEAVTAVEG